MCSQGRSSESRTSGIRKRPHTATPRAANSHERSKRRSSGERRLYASHEEFKICSSKKSQQRSRSQKEPHMDFQFWKTSTAATTSVVNSALAVRPVWHGRAGTRRKLGQLSHGAYESKTKRASSHVAMRSSAATAPSSGLRDVRYNPIAQRKPSQSLSGRLEMFSKIDGKWVTRNTPPVKQQATDHRSALDQFHQAILWLTAQLWQPGSRHCSNSWRSSPSLSNGHPSMHRVAIRHCLGREPCRSAFPGQWCRTEATSTVVGSRRNARSHPNNYGSVAHWSTKNGKGKMNATADQRTARKASLCPESGGRHS